MFEEDRLDLITVLHQRYHQPQANADSDKVLSANVARSYDNAHVHTGEFQSCFEAFCYVMIQIITILYHIPNHTMWSVYRFQPCLILFFSMPCLMMLTNVHTP
jgi:hypothetical protein